MTLQRIETALARLEAAAARARPAPPAAPDALAQMTASNARLRDAVGQAMRRIDALILAQDAASHE